MVALLTWTTIIFKRFTSNVMKKNKPWHMILSPSLSILSNCFSSFVFYFLPSWECFVWSHLHLTTRIPVYDMGGSHFLLLDENVLKTPHPSSVDLKNTFLSLSSVCFRVVVALDWELVRPNLIITQQALFFGIFSFTHHFSFYVCFAFNSTLLCATSFGFKTNRLYFIRAFLIID